MRWCVVTNDPDLCVCVCVCVDEEQTEKKKKKGKEGRKHWLMTMDEGRGAKHASCLLFVLCDRRVMSSSLAVGIVGYFLLVML